MDTKTLQTITYVKHFLTGLHAGINHTSAIRCASVKTINTIVASINNKTVHTDFTGNQFIVIDCVITPFENIDLLKGSSYE